MKQSIILNVDSYKVSMDQMYPENTTKVYSYIESRGGMYPETLFFGIQAFIKEYLTQPITQEEIDRAEHFWGLHGEVFNKDNWQYILDTHKGHLPLVIKSVPEGSIVPVGNVLVTVENTDPNCYWLTTWVETALLRAIWYPTTVASQGLSIKRIIKKFLDETGDSDTLQYKLIDFGARGVSSNESAVLGGMAHLVNFSGTDTVAGVLGAMEYYNGGMVGTSVIASEHSVITSWGRENEADSYRNVIKKFNGKIISLVADSYDIYNACRNIFGKELKDDIINMHGFLVIRPDSGVPIDVICGYTMHNDDPEHDRGIIRILAEEFGTTTNSKGYKVLNNVRILQGDGIDGTVINNILEMLKAMGYSADNIIFGMGGQNLQKVDRDTMKFAMKCSSICVDGEWRTVQKDPITDSGKKSKAGRVILYKTNGEYHSGVEDWEAPALVTTYLNGSLLNEISFDEIRNNACI